MIIAPEWIWLHIPKCGGTTTERILRNAFGNRKDVAFDDVGPNFPVIWHQNFQKRQEIDPGFQVGSRKVIANIRRLPSWVLSRVHFEVQRSGAKGLVPRHQLTRARYREAPGPKGRASPIRSADQMLEGYADSVTHWVRTEHLLEDLGALVDLSSCPASELQAHENKNRIDYIRQLSFWFTRAELERMYNHNPVWAELETKVYGDILKM